MAETGEMLVRVLEGITTTNERLVEIMTRMEEKHDATSLALAQILERIEQRKENTFQQLSSDNRILGEMLVRLGETLSRAEQMAAQTLATIATRGPAQ